MDIVRLPKFAFCFYQSQAGTDINEQLPFGKPIVFIANYWNDPALKKVKVFSNGEEVELLLHGKSVARQKPDRDQYSTHLLHPPFTFNPSQYKPGILTAIAYSKGVKVAETSQRIPETPTKLTLRVDESGKALQAVTNDPVFVYARITDKNETVVPAADNMVTFRMVTGDARIIGPATVKAEAGVAAILLQAGAAAGRITLEASAENLAKASTTINAVASDKN